MSPYVNTTKIVYKNNEGNVQKFTLWIRWKLLTIGVL